MRYRALLIDADNTLFDFDRAERRAIQAVADRAGISDPDFPQIYHEINAGYWRKLEQGLITQNQLKIQRFRDVARRYALSLPPEALLETFMGVLSRSGDLYPGAADFLRQVSAHMPVAIVTNGIAETQHGRFDVSPIMPYVKHLVISGEVGCAKPDPRLIQRALSLLNVAPAHALMIGDGLYSDMLCANRARVDAYWYNPASLPAPTDLRLAGVVHDYAECLAACLG